MVFERLFSWNKKSKENQYLTASEIKSFQKQTNQLHDLFMLGSEWQKLDLLSPLMLFIES